MEKEDTKDISSVKEMDIQKNVGNTQLTEKSEHRLQIEKKIKFKIDLWLTPTLVIIFIMNYIDRNNITTARLKGLEEDLGLTDLQYRTCIALLYVSYILFQVPSNMILNHIGRPSLYIGGCVVAWGFVSCLCGVTENFSGMAATRFFVGIPEAAYYPGAIYLLSRWYTKKELAFRSALLYMGLIISNALGTLMAAGILSGMEGALGHRGWRWLFYVEGAITMAVGVISMYTLPDYPHNSTWFNEEEREIAQLRLAEDTGEADKDNENETALQGLKLTFSDPLVYIFFFMTFFQLIGLSYVNFFPTLAETLGYESETVTLLLAAPPWVLAAIIVLINSWNADRTGERYGHLTWTWWSVSLGYIIAMSTMNTAARYVSLFLMAIGYAGFALTMVWVSNSLPRPPIKRAISIGFINGFGNSANIAGSYIWKSEWGPSYQKSMGVCLAFMVAAIAMGLVVRQVLVNRNKKLDILGENVVLDNEETRKRVEEAAATAGITVEEAMSQKGNFRYLV